MLWKIKEMSMDSLIKPKKANQYFHNLRINEKRRNGQRSCMFLTSSQPTFRLLLVKL